MSAAIELGANYRDTITGYSGVATARTVYITGCNQVLLQQPIGKDGAYRDPCWFDEPRLERVGSYVHTIDNGESPGFGPEAPKR